ncbi:hypothetical protein STEG23_017549 [Scotinomys teguina]
MVHFLPQSCTSPNDVTNWGPSIQVPETVGTLFIHSTIARLPEEGVAQIKGVSSSLKVQIKGMLSSCLKIRITVADWLMASGLRQSIAWNQRVSGHQYSWASERGRQAYLPGPPAPNNSTSLGTKPSTQGPLVDIPDLNGSKQ